MTVEKPIKQCYQKTLSSLKYLYVVKVCYPFRFISSFVGEICQVLQSVSQTIK